MALVPLGVVLVSVVALDFVVADFVIPVVLAELAEVSSLVIAAWENGRDHGTANSIKSAEMTAASLDVKKLNKSKAESVTES